MANDNQVTLEINVDAKDAQKAIELFGASAVKSIKKTEKEIESFSDTVKGIGAGLKAPFLPIIAGITAVTAAFASVSRAIDEAAKDSLQLKQIDAALKATGEGGKEAVDAIVDFADAIKDATGLSDDLVKSAFVTAKSFGLNTEEAKKLTKAAIDLAAATGVDVETAVRQLGGTVDGSIGKIANLGAEFRNLSTEQLKNGAAIDLVARKYEGSAAAGFDTFQGATNSLNNSLDDLLKAFGKAITESEGLIKAVRLTADAINYTSNLVPKLLNPLKETQDKLDAEKAKKFVDQIELIGNKSAAAAPKVGSLVASLANTVPQSTIENFSTFGGKLTKVREEAVKFAGLTGKQAEEARKKFDELLKSIENAGLSEIDIAARVREKRLKILEQGVKDGVGTGREYLAARTSIENDFIKVASETQKKILDDQKKATKDLEAEQEKRKNDAKKAADEAKAHIEKLAADPVSFILDGKALTASADEWGAIAAGVLNNALSGRSGAVKAVSGIAGGVAEAYLKGLGPVVSSIFEKLAAGKEQAKAFVKEFVSSLPEIVTTIAEAFPAIIEGLVEVFSRPSFWVGAAKAYLAIFKIFPQIMIDAFKTGVQLTIQNLGPAFAKIFGGIGPAFADAIKGLVDIIGSAFSGAFSKLSAIFQGVTQAFKDTLAPITNAINTLKEAVDKVGGIAGKGGGEGVLKETFSGRGAAQAGQRYTEAVLTGGVSEIPGVSFGLSDMSVPGSGGLSQALAGGGGQDSAILMAILQAVQQPMVVNSQVKVNQSAFADIILQLNRQNARLTA